MDGDTVEIKLLPVCECGYVFRELIVMESIDMGTTTFHPCSCPKCGKIIKTVSLTHNFENGVKVLN